MIEYSEDLSHVTAGHLGGFFEGWAQHPSPDAHLRILQSSFAAVVARDSSTGQVVGFATALSDGVLSAYIPLLEVRSSYQRRGIGSRMIQCMLERLGDLYMVDLVCDSGLKPFYERLGFVESSMLIRLSTTLRLTSPAGSVTLDPEHTATLAPLLSLLGLDLTSAVVAKTGGLTLLFEQSHAITIDPHPQYEAWEAWGSGVAGRFGYLCGPSGGSPWG